ncbi:restriction endonuclease subunit S [Thiothrix nivea]|uniref:Restriction modification system DNA specificity domain-containing protein n=1 Tax=Thiothrix nivea (strain ATCC 35100 / DSM 5205 / JP2) TaxID=870187 RepID=A0A656HI53_THINJ|nr:restriction endonuclease subunit S [Thiothrix nivea]EIJ35176.1 restriction modification system DNA specificity domain-containing protein [Thiothrix nivea DSM 5205]
MIEYRLGDLFKSSRKKGWNGLPLFSVTLNDGLVIRSELDRRTETNLDSDEHLLVQKGYIAYNMVRVWKGALGRASCDGMVSPAYVVLKPTQNADSLYAEYLFKTPRIIYLFWAYSYGLTKDRLRLYYNDFARVSVKFPPPTEQLLASSQQQKKALMQQLLMGKKRLKGFEGEWRTHDLSEIAIITMGSSPKSEAYNDLGMGLPLIQGNADVKNRKSVPRVFTSEITKECRIGDILLSVRAPVGTIALSKHNACIGRGIASIRAILGVSQDYLYHWLFWFEPMWVSLSRGSTFESINSDDIKKLKMKLPAFEEQQAIAAVLSAADREIELLQQKLEGLKQEKKALMQQLLTGKRRVKA